MAEVTGSGIPDTRDPDMVSAETEAGVVGAPVSTNLTPSGIEIAYYLEPKRKYEVRGERKIAFQHVQYDWREVPSVTTVIDKFKDPGGLIWWAMRVGIEGVLELHNRGLLHAAKTEAGEHVLACIGRRSDGSTGSVVAGLKEVEHLLKLHGLTTNDVKSSAGDRGTNVHREALEEWVKGHTPNPVNFPASERGYVEGLLLFLDRLETGEPEIVASERMVGSLEHGFAGRYDLEVVMHKPFEIAHHWTPKRGPQYMTVPPGRYVLDLKTSSGVYDSHYIQLEGYEIARRECGYPHSDDLFVVHVHPGDPENKKQPDAPYYQFKQSKAKPSAFLATLALYNEYKEL